MASDTKVQETSGRRWYNIFQNCPSPRICHAKVLFRTSLSVSSARLWVLTAALELLFLLFYSATHVQSFRNMSKTISAG